MKYAMNLLSNERWTTLGLELIAILLAAGVGFIHIFEAWPHPWVPLLWMSAILVIFLAYRGGLLIRKHFFPPTPAAELADSVATSDLASLQWSAVEPNLRSSDLQPRKLHIRGVSSEIVNSEQATMALSAISLVAGADDPTDFLDAQALRAETDADLVAPTAAAIPLYAESTMSIEQRTLMLEAVGETPGAPSPNKRPQAVGAAAPDDEQKTMALDSQSLDARLETRAPNPSTKNIADAVISSPRRPFQKPAPSLSKPRPALEAPTQAEPLHPQKAAASEDVMQVIDARELARQLQEQQTHKKPGQGENS